MFLAFNNGAELLITSEEKKLIPEILCQTLFDRHRVTVFQPTPSLLYYIGEELVSSKLLSKSSTLSVLAIGGEPCPSLSDLRKWKHPECKTRLFNIYGITEVSSWATYHHITDDELSVNGDDDQIGLSNVCKLGNPLSRTKLVVYDDNGGLVNENGVGHLWIGGNDRQCLLECEAEENVPVMRDSGDIVQMKDSHMWYMGRSNNQIKRFGQKINLDYIERIIREYTEVTACTLVLEPVSTLGTLLHLFVVPKLFEKRTSEELEKYKFALLERIGELLPKVSQPDHVHLVRKFPLTSHGKVDKREILRRTTECNLQGKKNLSVVAVLSELWLSTIDHNLGGRSLDEANNSAQGENVLTKPLSRPYVEPGDMFMLQGGNSLLAVQLAGRIENWMHNHCSHPVDLSKLFETITNKNFGFLVNYLQTVLQSSGLENSQPIADGKRSLKEDLRPTAKMLKRDLDLTNSDKATCACFVKRGSDVFACALCDTHSGCFVSLPKTTSLSAVHGMTMKWSVYLEKCVDASPLVVPSCLTGEGTVFIGSHSHLFLSVILSNGEVLWRTRLGDRIESSGCLSLCGQLVVVGCYDGKVYALARNNGKIMWTYQTHDVVKSSPCVDLKTGLIWVGSHDGHLYGLDVDRKKCHMRVNCREGSCFSSPVISYHPHHVYVGTLAGYFLCIDAVSGDIKWLKRFKKPIFSSLLIQENKIFVATVNGCLRCLNHDGVDVWEFNIDASIFSSPLGSRRQEIDSVNHDDVIFASHGQKVYCISSEGKRKWSTSVDGPVYATPCFTFYNYDSILQKSSSPAACVHHNNCVIVVTTKGTVYLMAASDGRIFNTFTLPGEIFSSPVIVGRDIVIGCRNDYLYCLKVT
ncbi:beta-alanine-activating enzyme-like isoform X2 [Dendronephthya gigantea]|nr:beta-alanine-activating enzyme-like isoform X2 [Dendronephthya gigantea]XP_028400136.1 beta-alanine-activating enzyme-like isoform X2 [Dendronephthya gigantea]